MAVINRERFIELATDTNPDNAHKTSMFIRDATNVLTDQRDRNYDYLFSARQNVLPPVNREAAITMFEQAKTYLVSHGYFNGKNFRPWEMDDQLYAQLDRSEAWWGFEFETGYVSHEARAEVLGEVWDRWDNVAFDAEGEGRYYVEITFAPQERSKFIYGSAPATEFMQYLSESSALINNTREEHVGTHFNLSLPGLQVRSKVEAMARVLNNTLHMLPSFASRDELFGRGQLYGGFFPNCNESATSHWLEGKLFRTTYDLDVFKEYLRVCEALTTCVEAVLEYWQEDNIVDGRLAVSNLQAVVEGSAPDIVSDSILCGHPWGPWINNCNARDENDYDDEDEEDGDDFSFCDQEDDYYDEDSIPF